MTILSGLGIVLSLVFGCLLLALVAELYYLLWWKKQRSISNMNTDGSNRMEDDYSNHAKELFYLFCWDKPSFINNPSTNTNVANQEANLHDPDVELGLGSNKDLLLKTVGDDGVESELMRLHNLAGPPRFLFTIKEETKEDLESDDGKSKGGDRSRKGSRTRSLSDLIMAIEAQSPYSPLGSPPMKGGSKLVNNEYTNPLFESSVEAEIYRLRASPPPKFKFLRDAEEKLYRRLVEEAQKSGILQEVVLENGCSNKLDDIKDGRDDDCLRMKSKVVGNGGKSKEREIHCSSQDSSPFLVTERFVFSVSLKAAIFTCHSSKI